MPRPTRRLDRREATRAAVLAALFGGLAVAVTTDRTRPIDALLRGAQPHPRRGWIRGVARGVKVGAKPPAQLPLAVAAAYALHRARIPGAVAVIAASAGVIVADRACKALVQRRRPPGYRGRERDQSFPSGHTAAAAALGLALADALERGGAVRPPRATVSAMAVTLLVGETRLLLDEHWPSDVLAGGLLGGAVASASLAFRRPRATRSGRAGRSR